MSRAKTSPSQMAETDGGTKRSCTICTTEHPSKTVLSLRRCEHMICQSCLVYYFQAAIRTESMFPAKCCSMPIRLDDASRYLPDKLAKQYKAKIVEYTAQVRTYCHIQKCSTFVPTYSIFDKQAVCPKCMASTCTACKWEWHDGPCIVTEDPLLMQLARLQKWAQCPHCRHLVERTEGCRHMTCWCGCEFCYACGANYHECECDNADDGDGDDDDDDMGCMLFG